MDYELHNVALRQGFAPHTSRKGSKERLLLQGGLPRVAPSEHEERSVEMPGIEPGSEKTL